MTKVNLDSLSARKRAPAQFWAVCLLAATFFIFNVSTFPNWNARHSRLPHNAPEIVDKCNALTQTPRISEDFHDRRESDRFVPGTKSVLLKNATIWQGKGHDVIHHGTILLDRGLIKHIGRVPADIEENDIRVVNVNGAWITPGIFDMHSHLGVNSVPELNGAADTNSFKGITQPWLRSLDGLNTHDAAYELSISGGVTSALILPGSANAIGGQAFSIKLRPTEERTPSSKLLEPPYSINGSYVDPLLPPRWRQMKHACGENPSRMYGYTRMDTIWAFRSAYEEARKIKDAQDEYCAKVKVNDWENLGSFPESLKWEALVDVLRGRVKIHNHCYEAVDLDGLVRLSQEFKFHIAAFHHAHEAYLVPELLKKMYGGPPAVAMFATNARYKREAYRGSEFAPQILANNNIQVIMKSDHPVLNSRYLLYEAQQAHFYGLDPDLALASVTSTPAEVAGLGHRIGYLREGYDADLVIWDSHPLALGATPMQVYIDGIPQLASPFTISKPRTFQTTPQTPNFDEEARDALKYDGLPPLNGTQHSGTVLLTNVKTIHSLAEGRVSTKMLLDGEVVICRKGRIVCSGSIHACLAEKSNVDAIIDLHGGSLAPGFVSYGSPLGLEEIGGEQSTQDGRVFSLVDGEAPGILGPGPIIQAVDGLQFGGRDALLAYRAGVTTAISAPKSNGLIAGLSVAFSLGAAHRLEYGAITQKVAALHIRIQRYSQRVPSVSSQIAILRRLLLSVNEGELLAFSQVAEGKLPLVINVDNADIMATLLDLRKEVEIAKNSSLRWTFASASEAHLLAEEIGKAGVGVIISPSRPFPSTWEGQRIAPGPPLTKDSAISILLAHNITIGLGIQESWSARNIRFDIGWAALEADGRISKSQAMAIASVNLQRLLGVETDVEELIAYAGGSGQILDFSSKVVAIVSARRGHVDIFPN